MKPNQKIRLIKIFDFYYLQMIDKYKSTSLKDIDFCNQNEIIVLTKKIVRVLKLLKIETSFNNLTNCNHHFLVKVLNYQNFFKNKISKNLSVDLTKLKMLKFC